MKIAIIGAGLAGLSCAFGLEQYGIEPVLFEGKNKIGDAMCSCCIDMRIFSRAPNDNLRYTREKYGLDLQPLHPVNRMIMKSPRRTVAIKARHGYLVGRGPGTASLENQIAAKIHAPVMLNQYKEITDLQGDFDKIVVATGNNVIPAKLGVWKDSFTAMTRHATVLGDFEINTVKVWMNTEYAKNAFCYLLAQSSKEASIILIVNDISWRELEHYWKKFLETEKITYSIIEIKDGEHKCGVVRPFNTGNIYIAGNAAGFTDDFVGVGAFNAIESGLLAARAIAENLDYNKLVEPIYRNVSKIHEYRKVFNDFHNEDFDRSLAFVNFPPIKRFIYNNPFFKLSHGTFLLRALHKERH